ncbi:MAG: hypothetical protein M1816_007419 [Peltula sp. TS41687]|nr:MAG: hypothetical protein M1816_007419 [Peltula sp. TS41687]
MLLVHPLALLLGVSIAYGLPSLPNGQNEDFEDECSPFHSPFAQLLDKEPKDRFFRPNSIVTRGRLDQMGDDLNNIDLWGRPHAGTLYTRVSAAKGYRVGFGDGIRDEARTRSIKWAIHDAFEKGPKLPDGEAYLKGYDAAYDVVTLYRGTGRFHKERLTRGFERGLCVGSCIKYFSDAFHSSSGLKPPPGIDMGEDTSLQHSNDWLMHCLEIQMHLEVQTTEAKALLWSKGQQSESKENKDKPATTLNNQMQTGDGLWGPMQNLKEYAMNKLIQITHVINSVNGSKSGKLSPVRASPLMANPAIVAPCCRKNRYLSVSDSCQ